MTVKEFLELDDESEVYKIKAIKNVIEPLNYISNCKSKPITEMMFKKVQEVRQYYNKGEILFLCSSTCGIGHRELLKTDYKKLLYYLKWIEEQFENIGKLEANLNSTDPDEEEHNFLMQEAGVAQLSIFEELNIVDSLALQYGVQWEDVERWPYSKVYAMMLKNKIQARINRRYQKLTSKKK